MIGVVAQPSDHPAVREFFELFKTPWQIHREGLACEVLLCANAEVPCNSAKLILIFGTDEQPFDRAQGLNLRPARETAVLSFRSERIPIYGSCRTFHDSGPRILSEENSREAAAVEIISDGQKIVRIGFDLFAELRYLLTHGQPRVFARIPTLELHIAFLRDLILGHSLSLVEIPPVPDGYNFIACLTHDVDHPRVGNHCCDHTMVGFFARALAGSLIDWARGRQTFRHLAQNYRAAFSLPFVYLGMAKDFWNLFDRYTEIEKDVSSTFFVIPERGNPGRDVHGRKPAKRAAKYDLSEIATDLHRLLSAGREIAVHGIDAWRDATIGRFELERVRGVTGAAEIGVRMHWLFYGPESAALLEQAGYSYDSTFGYNDVIGYRAGTVQVFKPLDVERLLELPLHVMDTAMFYPSYMGLSLAQAKAEVDGLVEKASSFGGVLTVNWHDRSIGPERFWDDLYIKLIAELKGRGAWMPTAAEAVAWFRQRRSVTIQIREGGDKPTRIAVSVESRGHDRSPGLRLRSYHAGARHTTRSKEDAFTDFPVTRSAQLEVGALSPTSAAA